MSLVLSFTSQYNTNLDTSSHHFPVIALQALYYMPCDYKGLFRSRMLFLVIPSLSYCLENVLERSASVATICSFPFPISIRDLGQNRKPHNCAHLAPICGVLAEVLG